jgi:flagellar motor switch protein FliM
MMTSDLLSQDEIDALLHGVDSGAVETDLEPPHDPGESRAPTISPARTASSAAGCRRWR